MVVEKGNAGSRCKGKRVLHDKGSLCSGESGQAIVMMRRESRYG